MFSDKMDLTLSRIHDSQGYIELGAGIHDEHLPILVSTILANPRIGIVSLCNANITDEGLKALFPLVRALTIHRIIIIANHLYGRTLTDLADIIIRERPDVKVQADLSIIVSGNEIKTQYWENEKVQQLVEKGVIFHQEREEQKLKEERAQSETNATGFFQPTSSFGTLARENSVMDNEATNLTKRRCCIL